MALHSLTSNCLAATISSSLFLPTLLCSHNLHFINSIHSDFYAGGCTSVNSSERVIMGRPYGGLCIMWRKPLGSFVTLKQYTERIIGIEVKGSTNLLFTCPTTITRMNHSTITCKFLPRSQLLFKTVALMKWLSWEILMRILNADSVKN